MIRQYVEEALRRACYDKLEDGTFCAEVPRVRGVLATGETLEECRSQLAEVVEEWVLSRPAGTVGPGHARERLLCRLRSSWVIVALVKDFEDRRPR